MKHLKSYKVFESTNVDKEIRDEIFDILRDISDNDWSVSCVSPNNISIWIDREIKFRVVKPNIEHLISYMKSVGYSNFIYKDDLLDFNQESSGEQKENYLPTDDDYIRLGVFKFIKDDSENKKRDIILSGIPY